MQIGLRFANREVFPSSRLLFVYRNVEQVAKSTYRTSQVVPTAFVVFGLGKLSDRFLRTAASSMGVQLPPDLCVRVDNDLVPGVLMSALTTSAYRDARRRGYDVRAVRYEDLVARPLDMSRVVLEYCRLPASLAESAATAFDVDSQKNSPIARSIVSHFREPDLTPAMTMTLNDMLTKLGVPLIGEPGIVEGTLSCC